MGGGQIFCFIKNFVEFYCKAKKALRAGSDANEAAVFGGKVEIFSLIKTPVEI